MRLATDLRFARIPGQGVASPCSDRRRPHLSGTEGLSSGGPVDREVVTRESQAEPVRGSRVPNVALQNALPPPVPKMPLNSASARARLNGSASVPPPGPGPFCGPSLLNQFFIRERTLRTLGTSTSSICCNPLASASPVTVAYSCVQGNSTECLGAPRRVQPTYAIVL